MFFFRHQYFTLLAGLYQLYTCFQCKVMLISTKSCSKLLLSFPSTSTCIFEWTILKWTPYWNGVQLEITQLKTQDILEIWRSFPVFYSSIFIFLLVTIGGRKKKKKKYFLLDMCISWNIYYTGGQNQSHCGTKQLEASKAF